MNLKTLKKFILLVVIFAFYCALPVFADELNIDVSLETGKAGNIYFTDENATFKFDYFNNTSSELKLNVSYCATGRRSGKLWNKEGSFTIPASGSKQNVEVVIDLAEDIGVYDIYDLTVTVSNGNLKKEASYEFSYVKTGIKNDKFGINTHFIYDSYKNSIDSVLPLLKNSGVSIVRDIIAQWDHYETEKGVYELSDHVKDIPDKLYNSGIDMLTVLAYGHRFYTGNTGLCFPKDDAAIEAFTNYAVDIVKRLKGKHKYFELWNEPNMMSFNENGADGKDYAKLAASVYPAIKEASDNEAQLVGVCYAGNPKWAFSNLTGYTFLNNALKSGKGYMDAVSWHPYAITYGDGDETPETIMEDWFSSFKNRASEYNMENIWITEHGWSVEQGNSEIQVAKFLQRAYALSIEKGVEKYFWFDFINEPVENTTGVEEKGWGTLRNINYSTPFAAKPAFLAMSAMNSKLANADFDSKTVSGDFYQYNFVRDDETTVSMIWHETGAVTKDIDFGYTSVLKTDMYGNEEILESETGIYTISATTEPVYYEEYVVREKVPFGYDYDVNTGVCSIYGYIESETKGVPINIILYKPDMSYLDLNSTDATTAASYFNQVITGKDGYFSYEFIPDGPEGIYEFKMSSFDGDERSYDLRLMSELFAEVSIKDNTIDKIKEGDSFVCNVDVTGTNSVTKVYNVYVALYKGDRLVKACVKTDEVMSNQSEKLTEVPIENAPDFDKIKAFVWEKELKPLTNSPEINR